MWQEERERVHNIDMFKLQVEKDKLNEEREAFSIEKNMNNTNISAAKAEAKGFATANDILDIHVENQKKLKKATLRDLSSEDDGTKEVAMDFNIQQMQDNMQEQTDTDVSGMQDRRKYAGGPTPRNNCEIIQEMFDRPVHEALIRKSGNEIFYKNLNEYNLDFNRLIMDG